MLKSKLIVHATERRPLHPARVNGAEGDDEPVGALSGLDLSRLRAWLDRTHPALFPGPLTATMLTGGRSNLTYLVETPHAQLVLRRPPLGDQPATAHDVAREFRIITRLEPSAVPVPRAQLLCEDPEPIGASFYLMQYVEGLVVRRAEELASFDAAAKRDLADRLVDTLAAIHAVDLEATDLSGPGRPGGYLQRQVSRWLRQLEVWGTGSQHQAGLQAVGQRLADQLPATSRTTLVHGDFRLDNLILSPDLAIRAVLDWEMATIGDPLADLGVFLTYWELAGEAGHADNALSTAMGPSAGLPPGAVLSDRYADRAGADLTELDWYLAFGAFKLAVVLEGVRQRERAHPVPGQGSVAPLIPLLLDRARRLVAAHG
jgi:aminoglycoside phosphotransferase (APT) family kinase protein